MTKRLAGALAAISAIWLTLALDHARRRRRRRRIDTADSSIPVDPVTTLEMHVTANCISGRGEIACSIPAANLRVTRRA